MKNVAAPIRIQRTRQSKMESPNKLPIIYVGRPTKWGNPFLLTPQSSISSSKERKDIIKKYQDWIFGKLVIDKSPPSIKEIQDELGGKNLACWCRPGEACHADFLLKISNRKLKI